jgi:hypothetical protein
MTESWLTREANCSICVRKGHGVCPGHPVEKWKGWCSDYVTPEEAAEEGPVHYIRCIDCGRAHDPDFCTRVDWEGAKTEYPTKPQWTCHLWVSKDKKPSGVCAHCRESSPERDRVGLHCHLRDKRVQPSNTCIDWRRA